jgi:hypothetical protein
VAYLKPWGTPLQPQTEQRAQRRSLSLDAFMPHRIMSGTKAIGA